MATTAVTREMLNGSAICLVTHVLPPALLLRQMR